MKKNWGARRELLRDAGENTAVHSRLLKAWMSVTVKLAAAGGQTVSQGGQPSSDAYERVTAKAGIDPNDAGSLVAAIAENVLEVNGLSPEVYPALTEAIWGAMLTGVEVARESGVDDA